MHFCHTGWLLHPAGEDFLASCSAVMEFKCHQQANEERLVFFDGFQVCEMQKESFHKIHNISKNFKSETLVSEKIKSVFLFTDLKLPKSMHVSISRSYL